YRFSDIAASSCLVSGYRFSEAESCCKSVAPSGCTEELVFEQPSGTKRRRIQAPEGRTNLAQRFGAGKSGKNDLSPGGTTQFSRSSFPLAQPMNLPEGCACLRTPKCFWWTTA